MKTTISHITLILSAVFLLWGCVDGESLLDKEESNDIYEEMVFSDPHYANWFLSNIYKSMRDEYNWFDSANAGSMLGCVVDEGLYKANWSKAHAMSYGSWSSKDMLLIDDPWQKNYAAIRAANKFMESADEIPDSEEPMVDDAIRTRMKAEARFLRAYFYFELLRLYGGVPLITKTLTTAEGEELHKDRAQFDELVEFICTECEAAAEDLPQVDEYPDSEWGRITKGACYAMVSRVRLMAASPLFNDPQNPEGTEWRGQYDAGKWKVAAEAAADFFKKTGGRYSLHQSTNPSKYGDYEDLFIRRYSPEIILAYQRAQNGNVERNLVPGNIWGNKPWSVLSNFPTLNAVSEYEVVEIDASGNVVGSHLLGLEKVLECYDSEKTDPVSGFDPQDPYINRDPRFYQSVWYDNEVWPAKGKSATDKDLQVFDGMNGGIHDPRTSAFYGTGFFTRKYCDAWSTIKGVNNVNHNPIYFRYAEMLLNYAEAVNEAYGPDEDPHGIGMTPVQAVNLVRARAKYPSYDLPDFKWPAGMPKNSAGKSLPPLPDNLTKDRMRDWLVHERWIEFYQEDMRYFDLNRWKKRSEIVPYCQTKSFVDPSDKSKGTRYGYDSYTKKTWDEKFYFFPIRQSEMDKSHLVQNPGW